MTDFQYEPSLFVPFRDQEAIRRCRAIKRRDIDKHPNPDFQIRVVPDADVRQLWLADIFSRIKLAADQGRRCVMLLPNPIPAYRHLAWLINRARINCRHVWCFALDEYADHDGNIAPPTWPRGFMHSLLTFLWKEIDEDLRPPLEQVIGPTNENIDHYFDLMQEAGGVEICYTGPGWTGHLAFIEPDAPEFDVSLEEFKTMGARVCTLSPFTIAQNSLHGSMGFSGDLSAVPPKAATVGPKEVIAARHRRETAALTVGGTATSWQRLIARLCYHGPVTPKLPSSIHQELRTDCYISESVAADIVDTWNIGY